MHVTILKSDVNHDEVVDMIQVLAEPLSSDVWVDVANDKVTSCADSNFVGNVAWKYELTVVPGDLYLHHVRECV